jgi:outer membrane protein TolC
MTRLLLIISFIFACTQQYVYGQQMTDFNQIIAPLDSPAVDFKEYLVQLAWINSPEGAIMAAEVLNAKDKGKNTRKEWMRDIQATINLNEANLKSNTGTTGNVFFPRYNFGLNLNIYNVLTQGPKNNISKREIEIAQMRVNQQKLVVRSETLSRYAQFRMATDVLKARRQVEQETHSAFVLIEQQYRTDEKTFEDYSTASAAWYKAQEERIRAENETMQAKIKLEEVIGIFWEQVIHPNKW